MSRAAKLYLTYLRWQAKARDFRAGLLFNKILPLLMERTLKDQEHHLLVKVFEFDDLVRPYVHNILIVIEPLD